MQRQAKSDPGFVARLEEIAFQVGGKAELAKRAELAPSSLQNLFGRSEPTRPILARLARAAGVSSGWLTDGTPPKNPNGLPDGYIAVPFLELEGSIYALIRMEPSDVVVVKRSWLERPELLHEPIAIRADESVPPAIRVGDILIVETREQISAAPVPGHHRKSWPIEIREGSFYLVALGTRVVVRQLAWEETRRPEISPAILVTGAPDLKPQKIHPEKMPTGGNAMPAEFDVLGRVIWRAGGLD